MSLNVSSKRNSLSLTLMFLAFLLPALASWGMYFFQKDWHYKTSNHGALIQPALPLFGEADHQWKMLYAPKVCNTEEYNQVTFVLHQLRVALGENKKRVGLALLLNADCHLNDAHGFQSIRVTSTQLTALQKVVPDVWNQVYLVDPLGNVFMHYPAASDPLAILMDLKKVLEVSQIG
jgi:hypothetical protein